MTNPRKRVGPGRRPTPTRSRTRARESGRPVADRRPLRPFGALAPWYGAKRLLAPAIVAELGRPASYFEPFCGSLAVTFAKPPSRMELVNDLHGDIVNLARVLQDEETAVRLHHRLESVLCCEPLFRELADSHASSDVLRESIPPDLERAAAFLILSWQGRNGVAGDRVKPRFSVRWSAEGQGSVDRWRRALRSIPAWCERLRHVQIMQRDGFELLPKIADRPDATIFVDPPYLRSTRTQNYAVDFAESDHKRLAAALRRFQRCRVVLSQYDAPDLDHLYPGWTKVRVGVRQSLGDAARTIPASPASSVSSSSAVSTASSSRRKPNEVLLINQQSLAPTLFSFAE